MVNVHEEEEEVGGQDLKKKWVYVVEGEEEGKGERVGVGVGIGIDVGFV